MASPAPGRSTLFESALAGFAAGSVHVLAGPDHLAAVAPLAADRKHHAWRSGLLWGLGHASGVLLVGVGALLLREVLPIERLSGWSERLVGVVLIAIGTWGLLRARRQSVHSHEHRHDGTRHAHIHVHARAAAGSGAHAHAPGQHAHPATTRAAFAVGILHGLAGSAHFLGVLPALALPTRSEAVTYVVFFGVGTVLAMTGFAAGIGAVARRSAARGTRLYRVLLAALGAAAIVVGFVWLLG